MQTARKRVDFKCINCKNLIKNKLICDIKTQGLSCPICKDSLSIGEKIMYQILKLNNIDFEFDKTTYFSKGTRYDFIVKDSIIIEMHGLQHYKNTGFEKLGGRDYKQEQINDLYKKELAISNGYKYFSIDCRISEYNYIIENIIDSGIIELLNLEVTSFNKVDLTTSLIIKCWELYFDKKYSKTKISKILSINVNTVSQYIKIKKQMKL